MPNLDGIIAVVSGATRGAGKGVAFVLGEAGVKVYVTGRSTRRGTRTKNYPGTIEDTADGIAARGGIAIPVRCDHSVDADLVRLFSQVERDHERLDVLVNNAYGAADLLDDLLTPRPFWEQSAGHWETLFVRGLRSHLMTTRLAVPLMLPQKKGLIVTTCYWAYGSYMQNVFYDVAMTAYSRLAFAMAQDLKPHGIASVALSPGFMRTELVEATYDGDRSALESVEYVGRAVAALAGDPDVMKKTGRTLLVGELAVEYGFTDVDGRVIPPFAKRE